MQNITGPPSFQMRRIIFQNKLIICFIVSLLMMTSCQKDDDVPRSTTPSGNASGDLSGDFPAPIVSKILGRALSTTAPTDGQGLLWNNAANMWEPKTLAGLGLWQANGNNVSIALTGNLGIGTATPTDELHIKKDINSFVGLTIENKDPGAGSRERITFLDENGAVCLIQVEDNDAPGGPVMTMANNRPGGFLQFNTGGNTKVTFANNGNVGIGTATPSQKLSVTGNICATGSIGSCSDIRYKKNIVPMTDALARTLSLHSIYYNWDKRKIGKDAYTPLRQIGFSAQEIEQYFPEIVQTDARGYKAVDYGRLTPILVEAIKEQQHNITAQQQQIDELKKMITLLADRQSN